jgi:DNA-directed RNA polymerase subunit RPC12/RpoP
MYSKVDKTLDARTEYGLLSSIISKERAQMMYVDKEMNYVCLNCKEIIHSETDRYCSYCGQKLKKEDTMSFRTYHWATSSDDNKKALTIQKDMVAFLLSLDIEVRFLKVTVSEDPNFDQVSNDDEDRDESLDATYSSEGEFVLGYKDVYTFEKAYEEFFKVINPRYPDFITLMLSVKDEGDDDTSI